MRRLQLLTVATVVMVAGGSLLAQDRRESASRGRGMLPRDWSRLGLTDEQKDKIYGVRGSYRGKLDDLERQIKELRKQERAELESVLTDAQKARLREIVAERVPGGSKGTDSKTGEGNKPPAGDKKPGPDDKKP